MARAQLKPSEGDGFEVCLPKASTGTDYRLGTTNSISERLSFFQGTSEFRLRNRAHSAGLGDNVNAARVLYSMKAFQSYSEVFSTLWLSLSSGV